VCVCVVDDSQHTVDFKTDQYVIIISGALSFLQLYSRDIIMSVEREHSYRTVSITIECAVIFKNMFVHCVYVGFTCSL